MGPKWVPDTKTDRPNDRRSHQQLNANTNTKRQTAVVDSSVTEGIYRLVSQWGLTLRPRIFLYFFAMNNPRTGLISTILTVK
jgi:hypothetical protein